MAKAYVKVTKTTVKTKSNTSKTKTSNGKRGNSNKCPVCGKFMGSSRNG